MGAGKSRPFRALLQDRLANREVAQHYLIEALEESPEAFVNALNAVAKAQQVTTVAEDIGVAQNTPGGGHLGIGPLTVSSLFRAAGLRISVVLDPAAKDSGKTATLQTSILSAEADADPNLDVLSGSLL